MVAWKAVPKIRMRFSQNFRISISKDIYTTCKNHSQTKVFALFLC
jgi:hypothetical protein